MDAIRSIHGQKDLWIVESFPFFKAASDLQEPWIAVDYGVVPSKSFSWIRRRYFDYIRKTQYGEYFPKASGIACISHFLRRNLPPALREKATVIHLGVDHYTMNRLVDAREELGIDDPSSCTKAVN